MLSGPADLLGFVLITVRLEVMGRMILFSTHTKPHTSRGAQPTVSVDVLTSSGP